MHVTNFGMILFELRASTNHVIQQVPQLGFKKEAVDFATIFDLDLKDIRVMIKAKLHSEFYTLTTPVDPQRPVDS